MPDEHDKVVQGDNKAHFARRNRAACWFECTRAEPNSAGHPCIYNGAEQGFDGSGQRSDAARYIR